MLDTHIFAQRNSLWSYWNTLQLISTTRCISVWKLSLKYISKKNKFHTSIHSGFWGFFTFCSTTFIDWEMYSSNSCNLSKTKLIFLLWMWLLISFTYIKCINRELIPLIINYSQLVSKHFVISWTYIYWGASDNWDSL